MHLRLLAPTSLPLTQGSTQSRISPILHRATSNGRCPPTLSITRCRYCVGGEPVYIHPTLLTVAALVLLILLVLFTLLGQDLLLGAARRVSLLPDQVEHSLSHPRVLGDQQLYNLRHSRWMMYLEENLISILNIVLLRFQLTKIILN